MKYKYWLANLPQISNAKKKILIDCNIGAEELFYMKSSDYDKISFFSEADRNALNTSKKIFDPENEWTGFLQKDISFITIEDERYPDRLLNISSPPYALFYIGKLPDESVRSIAIVGARGRSAYGCEITKKLSYTLAKAGIQVISGMARGIDRDAHLGCLEASGDTFAVLGSGVDICYPKENRFLYDKMMQTGGIISENVPGTQPKPMFFPLRNRIISGLSDIVVIVEAKNKSGSLITADYAMEQGKDVYAVPGRITDSLSLGCNRLIKQGAGIIYDINEFVSDITMTRLTECTQMDFRKNLLDKKESLVYSLLDFCPVNIGTLSEKVPYELTELFEILDKLVQKGFIKETISNYYIKTL